MYIVGGHGVWIGVECPSQPVRNDILTPRHLFSCFSGGVKIDISEFPTSYKENGIKEREILQIAENFRRQYIHLYRDRKVGFNGGINLAAFMQLYCDGPSIYRFAMTVSKAIWKKAMFDF